MCTEYPTTANDAFQTSGTCVFRKAYVQNARATCCDPVAYGNFAGRETRGPGALEDVRFHPLSDFSRQTASCCCKIWYMPVVDNYRDRYVVAVDTGAGTSDAADFSYIKVFDRLPMITGGVPEVVCTWHGRVDPDYIPWIAVTISEAYNHALLVIESNKLESSDNTEYLLEEIAEIYDNLYSRTSPEQIRKGAPKKWGFHTNTSTKPLIITDLNAALRDGMYIEHDIDTCDELDQYEYKDLEKKVMGAVDGCHDDRVMATAIGNRVCHKWPLPVPMQSSRYRRPRIVSEASI